MSFVLPALKPPDSHANARTHLPVVLHRVVPRIQDPDARDLHHEHGGPQHVPGVVAPELDALVLHALCRV